MWLLVHNIVIKKRADTFYYHLFETLMHYIKHEKNTFLYYSSRFNGEKKFEFCILCTCMSKGKILKNKNVVCFITKN